MNEQDIHWMDRAIEISKQCASEDQEGRPVPKVGAVAVNADGNFLCEAYRGGRDDPGEHAEFIVLDEARIRGIDLTGATIYTTLEPCTERGTTKEGEKKIGCAYRLRDSSISRVFIGIIDPNISVFYEGCKVLSTGRKAIDFIDTESATKIEEINAHFIKYINKSGGYPVPISIFKTFNYTNFWAEKDNQFAIREFVLENWGRALGLTQKDHLEAHEVTLLGEVRPIIRNSRRWFITTPQRVCMMKEIKRKAIADPERVSTKHLLLKYIEQFDPHGFSTKPPLRPDGVPTGQYYVTLPDGQDCIYELYEVPDNCDTTFEQYASFSSDACSRLAELLLELDIIWKSICTKDHHLKSLLIRRFPKKHQFEYLDMAIDRIRQLSESLCTLHGSDNRVCIVANSVLKALADQQDSEEDQQAARKELGYKLVHGDVTEDNVRVDNQKMFWLFDWDSVRAVQTGPFDLAFALVRLSSPARKDTPIAATEEEKQAARLLLREYLDAYRRRVGDVDQEEFDRALNLAFEDVKTEFCLRMLEYFEVLTARKAEAPDISYVQRCNPARVDQIRLSLTGR